MRNFYVKLSEPWNPGRRDRDFDRNCLQLYVSYIKGTGFCLRVSPAQDKGDGSVLTSPMTDPSERMVLVAASRDSKKKQAELNAEVERSIAERQGRAWEFITAFAAKHGLKL